MLQITDYLRPVVPPGHLSSIQSGERLTQSAPPLEPRPGQSSRQKYYYYEPEFEDPVNQDPAQHANADHGRVVYQHALADHNRCYQYRTRNPQCANHDRLFGTEPIPEHDAHRKGTVN